MKVHVLFNIKNPDAVKYFIAPVSLVEWIKNINLSDAKGNLQLPTEVLEDFGKIYSQIKSLPNNVEVTQFYFENEIMNAISQKLPQSFNTLAEAWKFALTNEHEVVNSYSFVA